MGRVAYVTTAERETVNLWRSSAEWTKIEAFRFFGLSRALRINSCGFTATGLELLDNEWRTARSNWRTVRITTAYNYNNNTGRSWWGDNDDAATRKNFSDLHCQRMSNQHNSRLDRSRKLGPSWNVWFIVYDVWKNVTKAANWWGEDATTHVQLLGHHCR
jgi:hypothetical protein